MSNSTTNAASILRPDEVNALIVQPLTLESVALSASTVVQINSNEYRVPRLTGDPATAWTPELSEIPVDDATFDEIVVQPKKVAGLVVISNELAQDSSPEASQVISTRLVQDLRRKVDAAWFAAHTLNGPDGLESIAAPTIDASGGITSADIFYEAQASVEASGATVTSFVAHPSTLLTLARLKKSSGSNEPLLGDASAAAGRTIAGVPVVASPDADPNVIWAISKPNALAILRKNADLSLDKSVYFTKDAVALRATLRVSFAFPNPDALAAIRLTAGGS